MSEFRFIIVALFLLISLLPLTTEAQNPANYFYHYCPNTTTFTPNSTYDTNLKDFLSKLPANAADTKEYSRTIGESPDSTVYGQFSCISTERVNMSTCVFCATLARDDVIQRCQYEKQAVIWYDNCALAYSNESNFFSKQTADSLMVTMFNPRNATDPVPFDEKVATALREASAKAASKNPRIGTDVASVSSFLSVYGLAQCIGQISSVDCNKCLVVAMGGLITGKLGGRVMTLRCFVRFEVFPFFELESAAPDPVPPPKGSKSKLNIIVGSLSGILGLIALTSFAFISWRRRNKKHTKTNQQLDNDGGAKFGNYDFSNKELEAENVEGTQEFPSMQLDIINAATKHFSDANKLGEGGFGPVYKGVLADGKEIAVKRLSKTSGQGLLELKNEVILIAKLQHRNLVRLLGCCLESNEKLLVYEYMPNRSLDVFLFDAELRMQLDWQKRFSIINGIARGIMYLHEDSRLRIIHRDLKASNILLDGEMNPKISDFGLAKIFSGNQNEASTNRIVGTYGYMAPEYAMEGLFSVKSDVFSFGVLLLEIVCGKKNNGFYFYQHSESLLTFAWKLWSDGQGIELIDPVLVQTCVEFEVLKCIHIGLLCVQKDPAQRPSMSSVIHMLVSETIALSQPTEPAFFVGRITMQETLSSKDNIVCSVNEVTLSNVEPR